jgi:hypothetical protein
MERAESTVHGGGAAVVDHPGPEQLQAQVDAAEDAASARYRRLKDYTCLITVALRHADAMGRLELALQTQTAAR